MNPSPPIGASLQDPPPLFSLSDNLHHAVNSPATTRQPHSSNLRSPHARHQSVPILPSPQAGINTPGQSRGLAKLTLVERLSKESIDSPVSEAASPKLMSPTKVVDEASPRPTHTPRRSRISLSIPPTKTAASPMGSPVRGAPSGHSSPLKHMSAGSLEEIIALSSALSPERQLFSPPVVSLEEVAALDDANATFLTLIAFQERRVVELREELARAESELDLLKQQWTRQQLKLTRSARQEHVRQKSLTKLEQQIMAGSTTPRVDREDPHRSPQLYSRTKRMAEGMKDGFFTFVDDVKMVIANESPQNTPRQRGRSPARPRSMGDDFGLGIVSEQTEDLLWYPKGGIPMRSTSRKASDESDVSRASSSAMTR